MKTLIQDIFALLGIGLYRLDTTNPQRATQEMALQVAMQNGLNVNTIFDVGAAFGDWTRQCKGLFPQANYILIEPLTQYDEWLNPFVTELTNASRIKAAAAETTGQATIFLHNDWVGSSLYSETEGSLTDGIPLEVETMTIDEVVRQHTLSGPFLIKIDVQGAEVQVLKGAINTLQQTEYLLIETSLFQFFKGGPLIHDLIAYVQEQGFVIYDILDFQYRLLDNALGQVDLAFVPEKSRLRQHHVYATPDQRREQTQQMAHDLKRKKR